MEWVDGNLGSKVTMKYPAVLLMEPGARGDILSVAFASDGMQLDAGAKVTHLAPHTTSQILSKSVSKGTGRASYRGLVRIASTGMRITPSPMSAVTRSCSMSMLAPIPIQPFA